MITSLNEWKKNKQSLIKEQKSIAYPKSLDTDEEIDAVLSYLDKKGIACHTSAEYNTHVIVNDVDYDKAVKLLDDYFKENVNENSMNLVEGTLYKIYDRTKGGTLVHSQAKYEGKDSKGYKFNLINRKENNIIWLDNLNNYSLSETKDFTTKPAKKK